MSWLSFLRPGPQRSAETAKERLQILMAHERAHSTSPDYLPMMQKEILAVIAKYVKVDEDKVAIKLDRDGDFSTLEVNIELPQAEAQRRATHGHLIGKFTDKRAVFRGPFQGR